MKKKILITGLNSYVGNSFVEKYSQEFDIDKISLRDDFWQELDFSEYHSVIHVAGIVHGSEKASLDRYRQVNSDLTIEVAKKAKKCNVKQFVFFSSMAVYGEDGKVGESCDITLETIPNPSSYYGISKYEAEIEIAKLETDDFNVVIIRPPMIYGDNCPGNYTLLKKLAKYAFIFPKVANQRSVIHIDNLVSQLKDIISNNYAGTFLPQDDRYFCTSEFIKEYRHKLGKKTYLTAVFNPLIKLLATKMGFLNKVFGNLTYEK